MRKRLWIPEGSKSPSKIIELPPIRVQGFYYVDLLDANSGEVKQHLEFPNLITDAGLDLIGTGTKLDTAIGTLAVGEGGSTPSVSDTALDNEIASTTFDGGVADSDSTQTSPLEFSARKRTRIFLATEANGNLTELGWKFGTVLVNRSLFKDANGDTTTVFKTDKDVLQVKYEYRIFAPLFDVTGSITIGPPSSGSTVYTIRPQNVNQSDGWLALLDDMGDYSDPFAKVHQSSTFGSRTANNDPSPSDEESTSSFSSYTSGAFSRDMNYRWTPPDGNFGSGINLVTWNPWHSSGINAIWQMHLSQSINKTVDNRLDLTFRQNWSRLT
jgi:hypothetical protein